MSQGSPDLGQDFCVRVSGLRSTRATPVQPAPPAATAAILDEHLFAGIGLDSQSVLVETMWHVSDTTDTQSSNREVLVRMRDEAQREVLQAERDLNVAQEAHKRSIEKLAHVQALLRLATAPVPSMGEPPMSRRSSSAPGVSELDGGHGVPPASHGQAVDAAAAVLEDAGKALHYREIYTAVERQGVLIRSSNPPNTLLTRMLRDGRFRPAGQRGYYELARGDAHHHYRPARERAAKVAL